MKKILSIFVLASLLTGSAPVSAAEAPKQAKDTVFNRASNFFSGFDRGYQRRGNRQGFCAATADWIRNINKE